MCCKITLFSGYFYSGWLLLWFAVLLANRSAIGHYGTMGEMWARACEEIRDCWNPETLHPLMQLLLLLVKENNVVSVLINVV